jgi:chemotaxis protein methyltransferase CheR
MDDQSFRQLLDDLGLSWAGYRRVRKGVKKRIQRHMEQMGCRTLAAYLKVMETDQGLRLECERLLTVSISRFFRDRELFRLLESEILPRLVEMHPKRLKGWVAGCARGEEVYSIKIVWEAIREGRGPQPTLELLATDLHPAYIAKARTGIYSKSSLKELPADARDRYFIPLGDQRGFALVRSLNADVKWRVHHLLADPPGQGFHLITLRNNLLTYYDETLKVPAFRKIVKTLVPGGFLIIGAHEKIPLETSDLIPYQGMPYVFQSLH